MLVGSPSRVSAHRQQGWLKVTTENRTWTGRVLGNVDPSLRRCWHPVARSGEIGPQPQSILLLGEAYVIYREASEIRAFRDLCPHRLAPLSLGSVVDGRLECAYHGWQFSGEGGCVYIPALGDESQIPVAAKLTAPFGIREAFGVVFIAPEEPLTPFPEIETDGDPAFMVGDLPVIEARASAGFMADNFLDMAHFPFVHKGTFGADEAAYVEPYEVQRDGYEFFVTYTHSFSNREDPGVLRGDRPLVQMRKLTYRYFAPFAVTLRIDYLDAGGTNLIGFFIQPLDDERCRLFSSIWRDDLDDNVDRMEEAVKFEIQVIEEDLRLQRSIKSLSIPLDPVAELHTRADRITTAMRKVLRDLVVETSRVDEQLNQVSPGRWRPSDGAQRTGSGTEGIEAREDGARIGMDH